MNRTFVVYFMSLKTKRCLLKYYMKMLWIPDCHIKPTSDLAHFGKLGELVAREQPDVVGFGGDFLSLNSISHWDMNSKKLTMEGRRYKEEVTAGNSALDIFEKPIKELQAKQKEQKVKQYRPRKIFILGNHSDWANKYVEQNPQLKGHLDLLADLQLADRGYEVVPYKHYVEIEDIMFTHVPIGGNAQPVSGRYALHTALSLSSKSLVFFHTHRLDATAFKRHGSSDIIQGLTCGCFFSEDDEYMEGAVNHHWKGVVMLNVFKPGRFDLQTIGMETLS